MGKFWGDYRGGVGKMAFWGTKAAIYRKRVKVEEKLLWRAYRKFWGDYRGGVGKMAFWGTKANALSNGAIPDPLWPPLPQDWGLQLSYPLYQWRIQDLPRGDHGEREEREPKWGSGGGAPSGFTRWRVRGAKPPEAESFL